jgi:crotonobetainyl-CoA:carnitine CoA-transferase CaiB-like acyl-CoA transferase
MGKPELAADPRFDGQSRRLANVEAIEDIVRGWTRLHTVEQLTEQLAAAGIPFSPAATVDEVTDSAQIRAREMMIEVEHPTLGPLAQLGLPIKLCSTPGTVRKAPPLAGEDNAEIYRDLLGVDAQQLDRLRAEGVV